MPHDLSGNANSAWTSFSAPTDFSNAWDARDHELDLRNRIAIIVAEKIIGVPGAPPIADDYRIADKLAAIIEEEIQ